MRLWRISNYADLSGMGGVRFPARWNSKGHPIVYTAEHPAGALVEFLVHLDIEDFPATYQLLTIDTGNLPPPADIAPDRLPPGWAGDHAITRRIGDDWLRSAGTLLLRVPSVLVPQAANVLINPLHPDAGRLQVISTERVPLDSRFTSR